MFEYFGSKVRLGSLTVFRGIEILVLLKVLNDSLSLTKLSFCKHSASIVAIHCYFSFVCNVLREVRESRNGRSAF